MADKLKQKDFKDFEKKFNRIRSANREERIDAVGLLTPSLLREHLKSGQDLVLAYGRKGHTVTYTLQDLKKFVDAMEKTKGKTKQSVAGVPLLQLERTASREDKIRMQNQIKNATLYRTLNNILHFQVTASGENGKSYHQVKVRLEEWYDHMTAPRTFLAATRNAAVGRISFDCSCGRHQYWFRYLATIGNFALTPKEKDFPKIRNPELKGCACKHVLKVFQQLKSPSLHVILSKEMERQSQAIGYVDKGAARFLSPKELGKARRAKGSRKESEDAKRAYRNFKQARKAFRSKLANKDMKKRVKELEAKLKTKEAREKALKARANAIEKRANMDKIINRLSGFLDAMGTMDIPRETAIKKFAEKNDMKPIEVHSIIEEHKL